MASPTSGSTESEAGDGRNGRWRCCCKCTNTPGGWVKVLATCLLILTLLVALLGTRFAFFRLAVRINNHSNSTNGNVTDYVTTDPQQRADFVRVMTMLTVVLMLPCAINVLRGLPAVLRGGPRGVKVRRAATLDEEVGQATSTSKVSQSCWETTTCCWFWKLSAPIVESFGLTLFCFKVMPSYDFVTLLLLMMAVVILPTNLKEYCMMERKHIICKVTGSIMQLASLVIALHQAFITSEPQYRFWHVIVAWVTLMLIWHLYPYLTPDLSIATATVPVEVEREEDIKFEESVFVWQLSFFTNLIKLFFIPFFTFITFYIDNDLYDKDEWFKKVMLEDFQAAWHWGLGTETQLTLVLVFCGGLAYFLAFWAYQLCLARYTLMPAIVLSLIIQGIFEIGDDLCLWPRDNYFAICKNDWSNLPLLIMATVLGILGQIISQWTQLFWECPIKLQQESHAFYLPGLQLFALDQWLMRNRRCGTGDVEPETRDGKGGTGDAKQEMRDKSSEVPVKVFICTTMYREAKHEMERLLKSIADIDDHVWEKKRSFQSHVVLDCGAHGNHLTPFALQLVSLLPSTLNVKLKRSDVQLPPSSDRVMNAEGQLQDQTQGQTQDQVCQKWTTPYGLMLSWTLPKKHDHEMTFCIHLKDPLKVKRKKRWSQILYLNYVMDWLNRPPHPPANSQNGDATEDKAKVGNRTLENSYILATDADVAFTPGAVTKLLDLMLRDRTVGAACARMHPEGSGPLYWCQVFEYAVGHWFQKATEHILGSVLCAPGCFSVYRCQALRDVLPTYASNVDAAFDFLTKDMGEDRWLCTLMIQAGWRIDYCAAASCRTYCPEDLDEFFKQRRRWIASTLANLKLLLTQGMGRSKVQGQWFFKAYQGLLLISSIVSPAILILFVSGGLWYAWKVNTVAMVIVQVFMCAAFTLVCLKTSPTVQINVAKLLVFLYAATMAVVAIGTAQQIYEDAKRHNVTGQQQYVRDEVVPLPLSVATIYLASIAAMFLLTAVLHLPEFYCVISGFLQILVLPSFSIILNIYSLVNITDISWGTREDKMKSSVKKPRDPLYIRVWNGFVALFKPHEQERQQTPERPQSSPPIASGSKNESGGSHEKPGLGENVEDWLRIIFSEGISTSAPRNHPAFSEIGDKFREHGFDYTVYISGMNARELKHIGIHDPGQVNFLRKRIDELESFEIDVGLPDPSVDEWLRRIGLAQYRDNFTNANICEPQDMDVLKMFSIDNIRNDLKIIKKGHIKRLQYAIKQLRRPTEEEEEAKKVKKHIQEMEAKEREDREEIEFWKDLVDKNLDPKPDTFRTEGDLQGKLCKLRNSWLVVLGVTNTLFLILMTTLAAHLDLELLSTNPLGLLFLVVFGLVFAVQFAFMLLHRVLSLSHWLARAKFPCSNSQCMSSGRGCCKSRRTQSSTDQSNRDHLDRGPSASGYIKTAGAEPAAAAEAVVHIATQRRGEERGGEEWKGERRGGEERGEGVAFD